MARFHICQIEINPDFAAYDETVAALAGALADLGHDCTIGTNLVAAGAVNILAGATVFAARHHALSERLGARPYIVYQLEQLHAEHGLLPAFPEYRRLLEGAAAIWDYAPSSTGYLRAAGFANIHHVPPGHHGSLETVRPALGRDFDVLFFGSPHPRRERIVAAIRAEGIQVLALQHAFGRLRDRLIARARVVLNMHAWDDLAILETVRLSHLVANRAFVVSESADHDPYDGGVAYGGAEDLPGLCRDWLARPQAARDAMAERAYEALRRVPLAASLAAAIAATPVAALVAPSSLVPDFTPEPAYAALLRLIPADASAILDIGCAWGGLGARLKARQPCHVTGLEAHPQAAAHAASLLDRVIEAPFAPLPADLAEAGFDCILLIETLEYVADLEALLRDVETRLAAGGSLIVRVHNLGYWRVIEGLAAGAWDGARHGRLGQTRLRFFTWSSLVQALNAAGFIVTASETARGEAPPHGFVGLARGPGNTLDAEAFTVVCRRL